MLLSISRSTEKSSPLIGLRSLLVSDTDTGGVVTRRIVASRGEVVQESSDVVESIDEEEENVEEDEGCWVSYGRRDPRRRLPPPIPSLAARGTMRRTRTEDGKLVITKLPVMWPEYYIRARRRAGRLTMRLVEREDHDPLPPEPPLPAPSTREGDIVHVENTTAVAVVEGVVHDHVHTSAVPAKLPAAPPPLPAVGCFEDVVKYHSTIGTSSLHQMPILIRMVH